VESGRVLTKPQRAGFHSHGDNLFRNDESMGVIISFQDVTGKQVLRNLVNLGLRPSIQIREQWYLF